MDQDDASEFLELAETISLLGTWKLDLKTNKFVWSDGVFRVFGYQPKEFDVTFETFLSIIHPEDKSLVTQKITEAIELGTPYEIRSRFITKNKNIIHVLSKTRLVKNKEGKSIKLYGVFQDISNIVKLEEEHQASINKLEARNEFIETVIEHLPIGIAVNKISTGESTIVNSSFSSIYGWSNDDLKNVETFFEKVYPEEEYRKEIMNKVLADIQSGDPKRMSWKNIVVTTSNNEKRIINAKNIPLFDQDLMISTVVDHTETIDSAEKYKYLFQNNPAIMMVLDIKTLEIVDCNEVALQKYGYTRDEFLSLTIKEIRPPEDVNFLDNLFKTEESYSKIFENTWRHKNKAGDIFYVRIAGRIIIYEGRKCSLVQLTDVTEKLLIEKSLKESEVKYRKLFKDNPAPLLIWDSETRNIVDCNIEALHLYGYSRKEFLKLSILDIRPKEDIPLLEEILKNNKIYGPLHKKARRHKKKNGEIFYVNITGHVINYNGQKSSIAMINDITKQNIYEKAIEESNQRFEYVTHATSDAIFDWSFDKEHIYWGKMFYKLFGYVENPEQNNFNFWIKNIHPDDLKSIEDSLHQTINSKETQWNAEYRFKKANGDYAYVAEQGFVIRGGGGKGIRMVGAMRDITQKKIEVDRLQLLESVITNTNDSVIITEAEQLDHTGPRIVYVNNAFTKITGYSSEEVIGKTPGIFRGPLSDEKSLQRLRDAIKNWEPCEITLINYNKKREPFWVNLSVSPVTDSNGKHTHWISIERDVTEQKNAEENLKKALLEKGEIIESIGDGFFAVNRDWTVTYWNKQVEKMLGISKDEIIGNNLWESITDPTYSKAYLKYQKAMTERNLARFEDYSERLDSWFETSIYPSETGLSVYIKDISERVLYIKDIVSKNKRLEEIAYTQSHIVRAPLARIIGIINLIKELSFDTQEQADMLHYLTISANELDNVIKDIVNKTEDI